MGFWWVVFASHISAREWVKGASNVLILLKLYAVGHVGYMWGAERRLFADKQCRAPAQKAGQAQPLRNRDGDGERHRAETVSDNWTRIIETKTSGRLGPPLPLPR